jgi:hypothetical protein
VREPVIAIKIKVKICRGQPIAKKKRKFEKRTGRRNKETFKTEIFSSILECRKGQKKSLCYSAESGRKIRIYLLSYNLVS